MLQNTLMEALPVFHSQSFTVKCMKRQVKSFILPKVQTRESHFTVLTFNHVGKRGVYL